MSGLRERTRNQRVDTAERRVEILEAAMGRLYLLLGRGFWGRLKWLALQILHFHLPVFWLTRPVFSVTTSRPSGKNSSDVASSRPVT